MLKQQSPRHSFYVSLLLHIIVLSALIFSFEFSSRNFVIENSDQNSQVISASLVTPSKIQMPHHALLPPKQQHQDVPKKMMPVPPPKPVVKVQQQVKKAPVPQVHEKTIAIPDHRKKLQQKDLIEKQLLADLKQAELQKKKKHKELEKSFAKELHAQEAKSLEQQLQSEQSELAANAQASKMRGIVDKYKALILESIGQHWIVPNGVDKSLSTQLLIRVAPGGTVLDVELVKSSGDDSLDRSARQAVFKASPLPVPTKSDEFDPFREFILKVKPENIVVQDNGL